MQREESPSDSRPLDWAMTQVNLGIALRALGERESGGKTRRGRRLSRRLEGVDPRARAARLGPDPDEGTSLRFSTGRLLRQNCREYPLRLPNAASLGYA